MYYDKWNQLKQLLHQMMTTMCNEMKMKWIDKQNDLTKNEKLSDNLKFDEIFRKINVKKYSNDKFIWRNSSFNRFEKNWQIKMSQINYRLIAKNFDFCWLKKDVVDVKLSK